MRLINIRHVDVIRLGRSVRALRLRHGWRQEGLAAAAGMSRSAVARVEQGRGDRLPVRTLERIAAALDARFVWRIDWHGDALDRLVDERHAELVESVVARLTGWGWLCATEVSFSVFGERGSIDVLAFHPRTRILSRGYEAVTGRRRPPGTTRARSGRAVTRPLGVRETGDRRSRDRVGSD